MKQKSKLSQKEEHIFEQHSAQHPAREFVDADELLRFDASQTTVPPEIAARLQKSSARISPPEPRPWWKNFFGR